MENAIPKFEELINLPQTQKMAELFYDLSGAPIGIIAPDGSVLVASGWQDICTKFHRKNPESCKNCHNSDKQIFSNLNSREFVKYKCLNGLWDYAYPLLLSNRHIATLFLGQFFMENEVPDRDFFIKQAKKFGFDQKAYLKALDKVPVFSGEKVNKIIKWNMNLAASLVQQAETKLKLKEKELKLVICKDEIKENKLFLNAVANSTSSMIYIYDVVDKKNIWSNKKHQLFFKNTIEINTNEINDKTINEIVHPDDIVKLYELLLKASVITNKEHLECELRLKKQGSWHWMNNEITPFKYNSRGELIQVIGTITDINDKKTASLNLDENHKRFLGLLNNVSSVAIQGYNINGITTFWNKASETLYGYTRDEAVGKKLIDLIIPPEMKEGVKMSIRKMSELGYTIPSEKLNLKHKQGHRVSVFSSHHILRIPGRDPELFCIDIDLTQQNLTEEKLVKTQEELRETSEMLRMIIEHTPSRLFWKDKNLKYLGCNTLFAKDAGYETEIDIIGKTDLVMAWKKEAENYRKDDMEVISTGISKIAYTEPQTTPSGDKIWLRTSKIPLKNNQGKTIGVLGAYEDITQLLESEKKLGANIKKFKTLSQSAVEMLELDTVDDIFNYIGKKLYEEFPQSMVLTLKLDDDQKNAVLSQIEGVDNNILPRALQFIGFDPVGKRFKIRPNYFDLFETRKLVELEHGLTDFAKNELPDLAAKAIEKLLDINKIYIIGIKNEHKLLGAVHIMTRHSSVITDNEYIESFIKQAGIIIERKILETSYKESQEKFKAIANYTANWESWIGSNGQLLWVNPAVKSITGYTQDEIMEMESFIEHVVHDEDRSFIYTMLENALTGDTPNGKDVEFRCLKKDGSLAYINMSWQSIFGANNAFIGIRTSGHDVTDKRQYELKIEHQNQELQKLLSTKDKLFSIIGHDLRNPLNTILGFSELVRKQRKTLKKEQIIEYNGFIHQSSRSMYNLLENLLLWARAQQNAETITAEQIKLRNIVINSMLLLNASASTKGIKIENNIPKNTEVFADKPMISTIIRNLISNAIKFTNSGGKIEINAKSNKSSTVFSISDNGIGIQDSMQKNLFRIDVSHNTKGTSGEEGTGLGLLICKEFAEKNGGNIQVKSSPGKGTTVYVTLPAKP